MSKTLVVYYSHSGNTRQLANTIAQQLHTDCLEIIPQQPYPTSYNAVVKQAKQEIARNFKPALLDINFDLTKYDNIFIGSPNWWSTIAPPIATFIDKVDFSAKKVIPFCTHGGGGFGHIPQDIKKLCINAQTLEGLAIYDNNIHIQDIKKWLTKLGF